MPILDLPDEVLLNIMLRVDSRGLRGLALTCRRFRPIAKESLLCTASFSPKRLRQLIDTLQVNPDLAHKLTHLQFKSLDGYHYGRVRLQNDNVRKGDTSLTLKGEAYHAYFDMVQQASPSRDLSKAIMGLMDIGEIFSSRLALVMLQATGLRALTMGTNVLETVTLMKFLFGLVRSMPEMSGLLHLRATLYERLEELYLYHEVGIQHSEIEDLNLVDFACLTQIEVPYYWLVSNMEPPHEILPKSLTSLRVYIDGDCGFKFEWFEDLLLNTTYFTYLRNLELRFEYNLYSQAWSLSNRLRKNNARHINCLSVLQRWQRQSTAVTVQTTFGTRKLGAVGPRWKPSKDALPPIGVKGDLAAAFAYCSKHTIHNIPFPVVNQLGF